MKRSHRMVAALAIAVGLFYGVHGWQARSVAFDRSLWLKKADLEETSNWRNRMRDDVIHRLIRPEMTKAEVLFQLGAPDDESTENLREQFVSPFPPGTVSAIRYITYEHEWAYELDGDAIYIFLDEKDHVIRAMDGGLWT